MKNRYKSDQSQNTDYFDEGEDLSSQDYFGDSDYMDTSSLPANPKDERVPIKQCFLKCLGQKNVDQIVACEYAPQAVEVRHLGWSYLFWMQKSSDLWLPNKDTGWVRSN